MSAAATPLRIRSAAELFTAMAHPQAAVRKAVIVHVGQQPEQALAFGEHQGRDVVDALIDAAGAGHDREEVLGILWAMQSLPDERLARHCAGRLLHCADDRQSLLLYRYLATHDVPWQREVLLPLLWQTGRLTNAELAAQLLAPAGCEGADRVRISAILGRNGAASSAYDSDDLLLWLDELRGPWADSARACLAARGHAAYASLATRWGTLDHDSQQWLLRWGADRDFPGRAGLIDRALQSPCSAVVTAALRDTGAIRTARATLTTPLEALLGHACAVIRAGALRAGARPADWETLLHNETDPGVLGACMAVLAREQGSGAVPRLLEGLQHENWTVVAAATEALVGLGEEAVTAVAPLAGHRSLQVRVAADRILCADA